jgi:hypothetical protein
VGNWCRFNCSYRGRQRGLDATSACHLPAPEKWHIYRLAATGSNTNMGHTAVTRPSRGPVSHLQSVSHQLQLSTLYQCIVLARMVS